jgi:hypothetical protein
MKLKGMLLVAAVVLACAAASVNAHAQTVNLAIMGSSALYQEVGQADYAAKTCIFINSTKGFNIVDSRVDTAHAADTVNVTDTAAAWVAWTPATAGNCGSGPATGASIDFYMNTDSVLGDRCFFASPSCVVSTNASFSATCGTALPGTQCTNLPTTVQNAINNSGAGTHINVAATDIRPEDAMFATLRALTPCDQLVGGSSQYYGLGLQTTNSNVATTVSGSAATIQGFTLLGGSFHINNFAIMGNDPATGSAIANGTGNGWSVVGVGAAPIVVFVNPTNPNGLGSLAVSNISRATLSGFQDGSLGTVTDMVPQAWAQAPAGVNTFIREPVSGTYNTTEYAVANSTQNLSSQDNGVQSTNGFAPTYCTGATVTNDVVSGASWPLGGITNPLSESGTHGGVAYTRSRAIGTGNMVTSVEKVKDGLGYAFWSQANFSSTTPFNAKYLSVDGVDPIQEVWQDGEVPTTSNGLLGNVSFSHVKDGSYPIWSTLRLVTDSTHLTSVQSLATSAQNFVTPQFPDFVLPNQMAVVHSHFTPPGVTFPGNSGNPSNGVFNASTAPEAGGDVAGVIYSFQADKDFGGDFVSPGGEVNHRQ